MVTVRDAKHTNFVEFRNFKIVYRRYAGLYFCICVDVSDNNLVYLEAIHNFVEVLNEYFHNVCELDLVFNFYKVYSVVDEMFTAGEIRETSQTKVLKQLLMLSSLEWNSNLVSCCLPRPPTWSLCSQWPCRGEGAIGTLFFSMTPCSTAHPSWPILSWLCWLKAI